MAGAGRPEPAAPRGPRTRRGPQPAHRRVPRRLRTVSLVLRMDRRRAARAWCPGAVAAMATVRETFQVKGIRCERCVARLGHVLKNHGGLESANATLMGEVTLVWD